MIELLNQLDYHHWLVLGFALMTLELFTGGAFFLWLSFAALSVGVLILLAPLVGFEVGWAWQLILFTVMSTLSVYGWKRYTSGKPVPQNNLNKRGTHYIGQLYVLDEPIVAGKGRLNVDDTLWKVAGPDLAAGSRVRVVSIENGILQVEAIEGVAPQ